MLGLEKIEKLIFLSQNDALAGKI